MAKDLENGADYLSAGSPAPKEDSLQVPGRQNESAPFWTLVAISMPRMAINMAWSAQWAALGPYLSTMLPNYAVQLTQVIGPLVGIFFGPMIGTFSDRNTSKYGRRRPILVVGGVLCIICWGFMSYTAQIGEALGDTGTGNENRKATAAFTIIFYFWMDVMVTCCQTPSMLLTADFAGDRQTLGSSIGLAWAALGSVIVAVYIQIWGAAYLTLHYFMGMLCVVMAVSILVCCIFAKETPLDKTEVESGSTWQRAGQAVVDIFLGLKALPTQLVSYAVIMFFVLYGYSAYNGNKGQFFGLEVYDGVATNADSCGNNCTEQQISFNDGVALASGTGDLLFCIVGYLYALALPLLVKLIGAKWVLTVSMLPQAMLIIMAFCSNAAFDIFIVAIITCSQSAAFGLMVPVIIHVFGDDPNVNIGMYVGSLNAANCFGQLLNYAIGSALVQTSLGYKLPILVGGIMSFLGFLVGAVFVKIKMYTM